MSTEYDWITKSIYMRKIILQHVYTRGVITEVTNRWASCEAHISEIALNLEHTLTRNKAFKSISSN